jgi:hypothetical protein
MSRNLDCSLVSIKDFMTASEVAVDGGLAAL